MHEVLKLLERQFTVVIFVVALKNGIHLYETEEDEEMHLQI